MGRPTYPTATELLITADSGGSNSARARLWKLELQRLANQTGLCITVCHFPPGTSKWNKIEHRMFCHITTNWRGRPLVTYQVVVNLIAHTTTTNGLKIHARLDRRHYQTGIKVTRDEWAAVNVKPDKFHGAGTTPSLQPAIETEKLFWTGSFGHLVQQPEELGLRDACVNH